jgi:hypothetical protein
MFISINDYIDSNLANSENVIRLQKYDNYILSLIQRNEKHVVVLHMTVEMLYNYDVVEVFRTIQNKIVFISSPDIDFPPPKKPYCYDMFFDKSKLPVNYTDIPYYEKIHSDLIDIIEQNNLYVFAHAVSINDPRVFFVPIGVFPKFNHFQFKTKEKETLCYANFGLPIDRWFGNPRLEILDIINKKEFIVKENISDTHIVNRDALNFNVFYDKIAKSKFAVCPRGCGIDTYRLWDCISLGCIPIVDKYDSHNAFSDLPVLFLDTISDFENLTEESLQKIYVEFSSRTFNYDRLLFSSIEKQLRTYQGLLDETLSITKSFTFGAYLQCHKNPYATYTCLESFRRFYPESTVVLVSDNGYDYTEMAKYFRCIYIHDTESATFIYKDLDSGKHIHNSIRLIQRVYHAFSLCKENYVMWLEDDVLINNSISCDFQYDINGFCPNRIKSVSNIEFAKKYPFIDIHKEYKYTGHGGSIFHKQNMMRYFENDAVVMDILHNWKSYQLEPDVCQDYLFSIIVTLNQGTIGPYVGHGDGYDRNTIFPGIAVQHQYKRWYGAPMPFELTHLVNQ